MKKVGSIIYRLVIIAFMVWFAASFINVNMANVNAAELATWNLFEIGFQLSEVVGK